MDRSFSVFGLFGSEGLTLGSLSRARNVATLTIRICFGGSGTGQYTILMY